MGVAYASSHERAFQMQLPGFASGGGLHHHPPAPRVTVESPGSGTHLTGLDLWPLASPRLNFRGTVRQHMRYRWD